MAAPFLPPLAQGKVVYADLQTPLFVVKAEHTELHRQALFFMAFNSGLAVGTVHSIHTVALLRWDSGQRYITVYI